MSRHTQNLFPRPDDGKRDPLASAMGIDTRTPEDDCVPCVFNHNRDLAQRAEILELRARAESALKMAAKYRRERDHQVILSCLIGAIALLALAQAYGWVPR